MFFLHLFKNSIVSSLPGVTGMKLKLFGCNFVPCNESPLFIIWSETDCFSMDLERVCGFLI